MAHQLLKDDGAYDRAAIVRRANSELRRARRLGLDWDRAKCLEFVWDQARTLRAQFLGVEKKPVKRRKSTKLNVPARRARDARCMVGRARGRRGLDRRSRDGAEALT